MPLSTTLWSSELTFVPSGAHAVICSYRPSLPRVHGADWQASASILLPLSAPALKPARLRFQLGWLRCPKCVPPEAKPHAARTRAAGAHGFPPHREGTSPPLLLRHPALSTAAGGQSPNVPLPPRISSHVPPTAPGKHCPTAIPPSAQPSP